jgi:nitrate reductase alpha subunit
VGEDLSGGAAGYPDLLPRLGGLPVPRRRTQNDVGANPLKPNNMAGGYGHLQYRSAYLSMNNIPKEVAVEVEKVREEVGR